MADFTQINQEIDDNIKQNGVNEITGAKMNTVLKDMVSSVNNEKQDIISDLDEIRSGAEAGATAFQKPSEGIPSTDMDEQVQAALDNAENAVLYSKQSVGITDQQRNTALANVSNQTANSTTGKMGYKVLDPTKTFASQVTAENTIYEIRDVFDLGGGSVTIPLNSTLFENGGVVNNGIVVLQDTMLDGFVFSKTVTVSGTAKNQYVIPQIFGAKGDGLENDTKAFQNCVAVSNNIRIPDGNYITTLQYKSKNTLSGILITKSDVSITCDEKVIIQGVVDSSVIPDEDGYDGYNGYYGNIIRVEGSEDEFLNNIHINGGTFIGVRSQFAQPIGAANEETQTAIYMKYVNNASIKNCHILDNQGDSIYFYHGDNLHIYNVTSENCRRTGISIGPSNNVWIEKCRFIKNGSDIDYNGTTNYGTAPCAGICLEGDTDIISGEVFRNIHIINNYVELDVPTASVPAEMVFVQRNKPVFVFVGNVKDLANENLIISGNEIYSKSASSDAAIGLYQAGTPFNNIEVSNNIYVASTQTGGISVNKSLVFCTKCVSNRVVLRNNVVKNAPLAYIYGAINNVNNIIDFDIIDNTCYGNNAIQEQAINCPIANVGVSRFNIIGNTILDAFPFRGVATTVNIINNFFDWSTTVNNNAMLFLYKNDAIINFENNYIHGKYTGSAGTTLFFFGTETIIDNEVEYRNTTRFVMRNNHFDIESNLYYLTQQQIFPVGVFENNYIKCASSLMQFNVNYPPHEKCICKDNIYQGTLRAWLAASTTNVDVTNNVFI